MKRERLWLIDIYRLLSVIPIIALHMYEVLFDSHTILESHSDGFNFALSTLSRYLSFSGYTIVFIFFFLQGFNLKQLSLKKLLIILSGLLTISILIGLTWYGEVLPEWDIYHFLFVSFSCLYLLRNYLKGSFLEIFVLLILALIPYKNILPVSSESLQIILYGNCSINQSLWPILPYLFFSLFAFSLGKFSAQRTAQPLFLTLGSLITGFALISYVSINHFYYFSVGSAFGCHTHDLPFLYWFMLMIGFGLTFLGSSSAFLGEPSRNRIIHFLSSLEWNTNFGLCYLVQWIFIALMSLNEPIVINSPDYFFIFPVVVFICTEITIRGVNKLWPS